MDRQRVNIRKHPISSDGSKLAHFTNEEFTLESKQLFISLAGLVLRLCMVAWLFAIADVFYSLDEVLRFSLMLLAFLILQFSKLDTKLLSKNIEKNQFRIVLFTIYAFAWSMVLIRFNMGGIERGLALTFDIFAIAPLSELFLSLVVYLPLAMMRIGVVDSYYFTIPTSFIASYVVLELLLRFARRILKNTDRGNGE
jgi:hypothetical protein